MANKRLARSALQGTVLVTSGQIISYSLSFLRNVILARSLTKADYGLAAVFGMTVAFLEFAGRMSFGQQIVQSNDGECRKFQATSHGFQFVLASVGALLMLGFSYPSALLFKVPSLTWAFALLSIILLSRGLENLDYYREQRDLHYIPAVLYEVVPQLVVTAATWPLVIWLKDFRAILWIMVIKAVMGVVVSHATSTQPYRWAWDKKYLKAMWLFGWPLILNGLLMFASQQADQIVVGSFLSLGDLASYALVLSLVSIPWFIFGQVGSSLMLPILSRAQNDQSQFRAHYRVCTEIASVASIVFTLPLIVGGEQFVRLFYGAKYSGAGGVMAILGASFAVRFLRSVPSISAMAKADTGNQLYSNIWRCLSLPLSVVVAVAGGGLHLVALCALVAEIAAATISFQRLKKSHGIRIAEVKSSIFYVILFIGVGLTASFWGVGKFGYLTIAVLVCLLTALAIGIGVMIFPGVMEATRSILPRREDRDSENKIAGTLP